VKLKFAVIGCSSVVDDMNQVYYY